VATQLTHLYKNLAAADANWIPDHVDALGWLTELEVRCGRREAGLRTAERAVAVAQALPASNTLARALGHLGSCLAEAARHEEAEQASRAALELWQELAAAENRDALINLPTAWNNLGNRLGALGRFEEAAAASQRAVGLYPSDSSHRANALNSFANQLNWLGRPDDARIKAQEAVAIYDGLAEKAPSPREGGDARPHQRQLF
jgi:tetratricopeptide (TPR) repeat protein